MRTDNFKTGWQIAVHNPAYWGRPGTWMYWLIRWATRSHWNHWAGIWVREDGQVYVVEMRGGGRRRARRITAWEIWRQRSPDRVFEVLECRRHLTRQDLDKYLGGYDYLSLVVRHPIHRLTGIWLGGKHDKALTCSEYWARVLGLPQAHRLAPTDLAREFGATLQ